MSRSSVLAVVLAVAALGLHLRGLGASALWQDEAETAVLAQRVLARGLPYVDDGRNLVSQNSGRDADARGLWSYSPWLALYAAAAGLGAFGTTAFAARLPFALCALGALFLLHRLSRRWSGSEGVAAGAVALTLASVPWLLHARQCRWYALGALAALYLWWAYEEFLAGRPRARLHLVLSSAALFHANFLVFFAVAGGVALHFLVVEARRRPPERADFRAGVALFFLLAPAMAYFRVFARADGTGGVPVSRLGNLRDLAWGLDAHVFPFLAAALAVWAARGRERLRRPLALLAGGAATLVLAPHFFFRYLVVFIPLASHVLAETGAFLGERRRWAPAVLVAAFAGTNLLSVGFWGGMRPFSKRDLADFAAELREAPADPLSAAGTLLAREAEPGELALVTYPDLSFMFHTPLRVVGGAQGDRPVRAGEVRWVVVRTEAEKASFPLDWSLYEPVPLGVPNGPWGNRPDPGLHVFRTRTDLPPAFIYRRR
ncbi:hypothetical protein EPO15_00260 [bacterium]|nr:MAG: hypothetical protein EPO15_00260 [bacterium]